MGRQNRWSHAVAYGFVIALSVLGAAALLRYGAAEYSADRKPDATGVEESSGAGPVTPAGGRNATSVLLTQVVVIILVSTACGGLAARIGQPRVIGEIVAGLVLGPSVVGLVWPEAMSWVFPSDSLASLKVLAEFGVVLFMFLVGMDVQLEHVHERARTAVLVSHASIVAPFILGIGLALWIFEPMARPGMEFIPFALFMGVGMSITAFPVLARIIEDSGLKRTALGDTALTCAAVDDVTAWCLLALVVAIVRATSTVAVVWTVVLSGLFVGVMLMLVGPLLARWTHRKAGKSKRLTHGVFGVILALVLLSSLATESIGIHSLFGAFLAGVVIPKEAPFRSELREKLEAFAAAGLLPIFFVYTGLRTHLNLLQGWEAAWIALAVLGVAVAGKLGGSMLAARASGLTWRDSYVLGVLMNARGLVELIVLNVGLDLGVLTRRVFSIMVLMALVTTFMTGPLLRLAWRGRARETHARADSAAA